MDDISFEKKIKDDSKAFLSKSMIPEVSEEILTDESLSEVLKAPDILEQLNEFENSSYANKENFMQGLFVGLSMGSRFGIIAMSTTLSKMADNDISKLQDEAIEVDPEFLN